MNKNELVNDIAQRAAISKKDAGDFLDAFTKVITETLESGQEIAIVNFGRFSLTPRAERMGRNPQTGEPMLIQSANKVVFKPGKGIKDAVN
ncbi:HU family DNA-binding protein [Pseudomonas shirazensis]|uniref:DNA-binding protein HU n=2 Tax=Pseudomonas TaxID=286 RepID=A0A2S3WG32_PSEPU|nr:MULTISPECIES: HU family DNA-binding protein [Pseudomonas]MBV4500603.1 HU family DNA-binding protein [Pseudomonas shirazensis]POF89910.1 DNA-binding protein HU [Pseudomonas putida]